MASSGAEADGPVQSLMSKRLRALRKKYNRILQMEERLAQGKPLNKEQEEVLRSKPAIAALIDEYEKLRQPLAAALQEELSRVTASSPPPPPAPQEEPPAAPAPAPAPTPAAAAAAADEDKEVPDRAVEDILTLLYFGCLFDVKPQSEFASTMLTRTHERGCCLTYDYVTDDATDLLGERDLDAISALGSLVTSRPVYSGVSHKNALQVCLRHAKLWLMNADQPVHPGASVTYAGLREKLNKILASDYFTTTPEMKAPGDVAAAVGKYGAACQVQISESTTVPSAMVQTEGTPVPVSHQHKEDEQQEFQTEEIHPDHQVSLVDEPVKTDEPDTESSPADAASNQQEQQKPDVDAEEQNQQDIEKKEQQYTSRRSYRGGMRGGGGGSGGRRGYANGRGGGGRSGRGGNGGYQNGRSQYYDSGYQNGRSQYYDSGYYSRNYYNARGRGGRSGGSAVYTNHGGHSSANVELDTGA